MSERLSLRDKLLIHKACKATDDTMVVKEVEVARIIGKHDRKNKKYNRLARLISKKYFEKVKKQNPSEPERLLISVKAIEEDDFLFDYFVEHVLFAVIIPVIVSCATALITTLFSLLLRR